MEKVGSRQCASREIRSYPIPSPSKGGREIQRDQEYARQDRTPGNQSRRGKPTTFTQVDEVEERKEIKQCSPTRTRSPADKFK
jgi:hypothetical protein